MKAIKELIIRINNAGFEAFITFYPDGFGLKLQGYRIEEFATLKLVELRLMWYIKKYGVL